MPEYITKDDLVSLGHDVSQIDPAVLTEICKRASGMVDAYLMQTLGIEEDIEFQQAFVTGRVVSVFTDFLPVHSVEHIRLTGFDGRDIFITDGIRIDKTRGCISFQWSAGFDNSIPVEIKYKHGYDPIPNSAKQAVIMVAKDMLDDYVATKMTGFGGVSSVSDGGRSISRQGKIFELPQLAKDLLESYRRVR